MKRLMAFACAGLMLSGCATLNNGQTLREYCQERPAVCILIGAAIAGGVVAIVHASRDDNNHAGPGMMASDERLKRDIRYVETLKNGIKLYAYSYRGSNEIFVGVLADEIAADSRFASAVTVHESGYKLVDYGKLHLRLTGADRMARASEKALAAL